MLAGCSNRLQRGKVPKELPLIRHTLARGLRAPGPPRAALPGLAERKASGIPAAVVAGDHSAAGAWSRWHAPSAPAPLAASLPRQSGAGFLPPHHLGGAHKHGAPYSSHRAPFRYSRRRGLRPRCGGQYRLSFSGCRVGPCRSGDEGFRRMSPAQSEEWGSRGGVHEARNNELHVCAGRQVGEAAGSCPLFRRRSRSPSRQRSLFSDHGWVVEGSLGKTCMKGWTSTRSKTPFTV